MSDFKFGTMVRIIPERKQVSVEYRPAIYIPYRPPNTLGVVMDVSEPIEANPDPVLVAWPVASDYVDYGHFEPQDLEIVTNV